MKKKLFIMIMPIFILVLFLVPHLQVYSYAESNLQFLEDNGGFASPSDMIAYDNYLFVCDTNNNRVQVIDQNTLKAYNFGQGGYVNESTSTPSLIACDNNYIYLCIGSSNFIKKFDYQGNYQNAYINTYTIGSSSYEFNKITSLSMDTYGNLYALHLAANISDSRIIKNSGEGFVAISIDSLDVQEDSRLLMSASSDYIIVVSGTKITLIDSRNYTITKTYVVNQTYTDVKIDHLDNLYFLNGNTITKCLAGNYTANETITLTGVTNPKLFAFNQVNGECFFIDETTNTVVNIDVDNIDHLSTFTKPTSHLDTSILNTEKVKIATLTSGTIAYNYPYTLSSNISLDEGDFVIVLDQSISENSNFYYCMITCKKDYNLSVYIHKNHLELIDDSITNIDNKNLLFTQTISAPTANIYKFPTSLKADENKDNAIVYSLGNLDAGDKITAVRYLKDYRDYKGYSFYEIRFENGTYGYINANAIVNYNAEKEPTKIKANATILTSDEREFVNLYVKSGDNYVLVTDFVLLDGTRVRLTKNFDKSAEYTEVKYVDNGQVKTAYVKTKFIQVDGISFEIIIAILLAVLCVLFSLILIVVIKKNKKAMR